MNIRKVSPERILRALKENDSLLQAIQSLGYTGTQPQYKFLREFIENNNVDISHHKTVSQGYGERWLNVLRDKVTQEFVDICDNWKDIAVKTGLHEADKVLKPKHYKWIKSVLKEKKISTKHFTFAKGGNSTIRYSEEEIFSKNSGVSCQTLKKRYFLKRKNENSFSGCDMMGCGIKEWNGKPISYQLDHINGDNMDNRIENLRILCPNCHSQTSTYGGRNIKTKGV